MVWRHPFPSLVVGKEIISVIGRRETFLGGNQERPQGPHREVPSVLTLY